MGDNVKRTAANEIKWIANSFKGLLALADQLGEEGSLDTLAAERNARLVEVEAQLAIKEPRLADVEAQLAVKSAKLAGVEARMTELQKRYG